MSSLLRGPPVFGRTRYGYAGAGHVRFVVFVLRVVLEEANGWPGARFARWPTVPARGLNHGSAAATPIRGNRQEDQ